MADVEAAVADSASVEQAAPPTGEAAVSADVTHGDEAETTTTPESEAAESPEADDDPENEPSEDDSPEEAKTKAQKRRERREAREEERIAKAVADRLEAAERERETKAAADKAEADAKAAAETWTKEFGEFVGTPETRTTLQGEIDALTAEIAALKPYAEGTDLDVLEKKQTELQAKVAERNRLNGNAETYRRLDEFQFKQTQRDYAALAASLPDEHRTRYLQATTVPEALSRLEAGIVAREAAKHQAELSRVTTEWEGKLVREQAAHAATRTGAPGAGPAPNGANGTGASGPLTRERFLALPKDQKDKIRREQPELLADIYARSA